MKVSIGVYPHKASVAVAVVDEVGELVACATFQQNRVGLRSHEDALSETVLGASLGGGERWRPRGRHLVGRLSAAGESDGFLY